MQCVEGLDFVYRSVSACAVSTSDAEWARWSGSVDVAKVLRIGDVRRHEKTALADLHEGGRYLSYEASGFVPLYSGVGRAKRSSSSMDAGERCIAPMGVSIRCLRGRVARVVTSILTDRECDSHGGQHQSLAFVAVAKRQWASRAFRQHDASST
ncbi:hypothetical protein PSPO01_04685 [Paraphaeosphaeria sporulosa]